MLGYIFVFSLSFKNCSQYLGSTFSQKGNFAFIIKKIEVITYALLQVISNIYILGVKKKKSCCLFHVFFLDFFFLFLFADGSQIDTPALPSIPSWNSDMHTTMATYMHLDAQGSHLHHLLPNQFIPHNSSSHWNQHAARHPGLESGGKPTLHTPN